MDAVYTPKVLESGVKSVDFRLSEEQEMMRRMTRDFVDKEITPYAHEWDKNDVFPVETIKKMHEVGLMTIGVPGEYGGSGLDHVAQNVITEEISRGDAGICVTMAGNTLLGPDPVLIAATDEQKKWWYNQQNNGILAAFVLTEPGAGSDAAGLSTKYVKEEDYFIINGAKQFITNGGVAGLYTVFATADKKLGSKGISCFMVESQTPGIIVGSKEDKLGIRSSNTTSVIFEDVKVPAKNLLGKEGEGFKIAMKTLDLSRAMVGAMATGVAQAAFEASVYYSKERMQFGKPISSFQMIQAMLADMAMYVQASRLLYLEASSRQDMGLPYTAAASLAKCFAGDTAMKVATDAVQIFGGYGYSKEYPVERYFRDAKIMQIFEGTAQVQRIVIAGDVLKSIG